MSRVVLCVCHKEACHHSCVTKREATTTSPKKMTDAVDVPHLCSIDFLYQWFATASLIVNNG